MFRQNKGIAQERAWLPTLYVANLRKLCLLGLAGNLLSDLHGTMRLHCLTLLLHKTKSRKAGPGLLKQFSD